MMHGVTSLAAVSRYWSVRDACGRWASRSRSVISGRSTSARRSSARVTGFVQVTIYFVKANIIIYSFCITHTQSRMSDIWQFYYN